MREDAQRLEAYLKENEKSLPLETREALVEKHVPGVIFDYSELKPNPTTVTRLVETVQDETDPAVSHVVTARFRDSTLKVCWAIRSEKAISA